MAVHALSMDYSLPYAAPNLSSSPLSNSRSTSPFPLPAPFAYFRCPRPPGVGITSAAAGWRSGVVAAGSAAGPCEYGSSLNTPHEPRSFPGRVLGGVLQNERQLFHLAAAEQLRKLAADRDSAVERMNHSAGSPESCLYRRIAELKQRECRDAVEDIMYMLIVYKFSDISVCLVPRLSKCIYMGRLEIWPSKHWELESIYTLELLDLIKEHVTAVVGLKARASVRDNWAATQISRIHLGQIYAASILYGYFLKSALVRHHLELCMGFPHPAGIHLSRRASFSLTGWLPHGLRSLVPGLSGDIESVSLCQRKEGENLRGYVMGFDPETLKRCAEVRSKEATGLVGKHCLALFEDGKMGSLRKDEVISTSFSSMKRLVLEALAFGSFLWEAEEFTGMVYKLED